MGEEALVAACLRRSEAAYREFITRFQADVFRLCVRMVGNAADAEEIAQESFLRAFKYLHRWDSSRNLKPWVLQISANRCRTWLSGRRQVPLQLDAAIDVADPRTAGGMGAGQRPEDEAELQAEIAKAVDSLRPDYRQVFILYHERGLDYAAIAAALEKPVGTVKTWLHRARVEVMDTLRGRGMLEGHADDVRA